MSEPSSSPGDERFGRDLTTGSIPRHLVAFSLPMLAGSLIQTAYSFVNAIWVGKFLGKRELAAVTVSFPVFFVLIAVAGGLTMAAGILVAQNAGARDWKRLRQVVQTSTALIGIVSLLLLPIGEFLSPLILSRMGTAPDVYPLAVSYMRFFLLSIPPSFGIFLISSTLRGVGDSKTPLYFQAAGLLGTAILDPILMFGWLGCPRLGLNGTAIASTTMQTAGITAMLIYMQRKEHVVAPDWRHLGIDRAIAGLLVKIGFPSAVQQSLISVGMLVVTGIINRFGENATAAFGAAMRIDQFAFMPAMTFSMAISTLVGQNIGARRLDRVPEVFKWGVLLSGGITACVSLVSLLLPQYLIGMFVNDPEVARLGIAYLRIVAFAYVCMALFFAGNGVLNGAGHTLVTTIISLVTLWFVRVPLAAYLSSHLHSVIGVWYAMAGSSVASMLISLGCYYSGLWKKPVGVHRHGGAASAPAAAEIALDAAIEP